MGNNTTKCYDGRDRPGMGEGNPDMPPVDALPPSTAAGGAVPMANGMPNPTVGAAPAAAAGAASAGGEKTAAIAPHPLGGAPKSAISLDDPSRATRDQLETSLMAVISKLFDECDVDRDGRIGEHDFCVLDPLMSGGSTSAAGNWSALTPEQLTRVRAKFRQFALMHNVPVPLASTDAGAGAAPGPLFITRGDYLKYYRSRCEQMLDSEFPSEVQVLRGQLEYIRTKLQAARTAGTLGGSAASTTRSPAASVDAAAAASSSAAPAAAPAVAAPSVAAPAPTPVASAAQAGAAVAEPAPLFARAVTVLTADALVGAADAPAQGAAKA